VKLARIEIDNVLGARHIAVDLTTPITIFAGANGSGKSSIQEAVRMALTGESVRVALKKDYPQLVADGAGAGVAAVTTDTGESYAIALPSGKGNHCNAPTLPFVLDAQRFLHLDQKERRTFLMGLMGVKITSAGICERLAARGCDPEMIAEIEPSLRMGFEIAATEAQGKARDQKAIWKSVTSETYGEKKAEGWADQRAPVFNPQSLADARAQMAALDAELEAAATRLGGLRAQAEHVATRAKRAEQLRAEAGRYAAIAKKLAVDEADLARQSAAVAEAREAAAGGPGDVATPCPECGAALVIKGPALKIYAPPARTPDREAVARLPALESALAMLSRTVENDKRDLAAADDAAKALAELGKSTDAAPSSDDIEAAENRNATLKGWRADLAVGLRALEDAEKAAAAAAGATERAALAHLGVMAWIKIADALAPDGIPGDLLAEALGPINERLMVGSGLTGWMRAAIAADMSVAVRDPMAQSWRDYRLLSESEQWRVGAMIAEAIAYLSEIRLLVLDRFDVLDIAGRGQLLGWLDSLAQDGEIDTALLFGTLKSAPAVLPETIAAHWVEAGEVAS
jgi:hypothetical protein